jgi:hypothetical protein
MSPEPGRSGRRRPIVAGARVRHILGAQGVAVRVEGNQVHVLWDDNGEELILAGFLKPNGGPRSSAYVCYDTTNAGTLPSARTSDV